MSYCVSKSTCYHTEGVRRREEHDCPLCFACIVTELTTLEGSWINGINSIIRTVAISHMPSTYTLQQLVGVIPVHLSCPGLSLQPTQAAKHSL